MKPKNILTCLFSILIILGCSSTAENNFVEERKEKLNELKEECDFATVEYSFPEDIYICYTSSSGIKTNKNKDKQEQKDTEVEEPADERVNGE
tara:strand:+ start:234 stop:512 length:279 start_codon:yes stop_codon:yes gene_type:complete